MNPSQPPGRPRGRLEALDLLRFFAAVSVVLYHYFFRGWQHQEFFAVSFSGFGEEFRFGYLGVELFFVVSGLVILMSCDGRSARDFVQSRIIRLYPAYVLAVLLTWIVTTLFGAPSLHRSPLEMLINLTMFQQFLGVRNVDGVYWTLTRELIFYGFVLVCLWRGWIRRIEWPLALWLLWSAVALYLPLDPKIIAITSADYSGYFVMGATIYLLYRRGTSAGRFVLFAASLALMHVESTIKAFRLAETTGYAHPWWILVLSNSFIALIITYVVLKEVKLYRFSAAAAELGAITYPLYLLHAHIGYVALSKATERSKGVVALGMFVAMLLVSWAIVKWWERPVQQRLRGFFARRRRTVAMLGGEKGGRSDVPG